MESFGNSSFFRRHWILTALNEEAAHYCGLLTALGTTLDTPRLRSRLCQCRLRVWHHVNDAKRKLIPLLKHKKMIMEDCGDLEKMHRVLSACLEFLTDQFYITFLLCCDFPLLSGTTVFIQTGISETAIPQPPVPSIHTGGLLADCSGGRTEFGPNYDRLSLHGTTDLQHLQKEVLDLNDIVYDINQTIAIPWDVEPYLEIPDRSSTANTENRNSSKGTGENSMLDVSTDSQTEHGDQRRIRCVSITVLLIIVIVVGGIIGILMGVLD